MEYIEGMGNEIYIVNKITFWQIIINNIILFVNTLI